MPINTSEFQIVHKLSPGQEFLTGEIVEPTSQGNLLRVFGTAEKIFIPGAGVCKQGCFGKYTTIIRRKSIPP